MLAFPAELVWELQQDYAHKALVGPKTWNIFQRGNPDLEASLIVSFFSSFPSEILLLDPIIASLSPH